MKDFDEACGDPVLYAAWLSCTYGVQELAERVAGVLRSAGLAVSKDAAAHLGHLPAVNLATFLAANSPFSNDDPCWRAHCRRQYGRPGHPSLSAEQRNGPRLTWGGGR